MNYQFTKSGYEQLQKEKQKLQERRPQVVINLSNAREQGDLSENAGYHAAKDELSQIDSRIRELDVLLRLGKIVEADQNTQVGFGSHVKVEVNSREMEFTIVNALEADPKVGKMSDESPIGKALLGKKIGDTFEVQTPAGTSTFKVLSINS